MIAALMLYSLAVTMLLAIAAGAAERLLRLTRRPARFVWLSAMIAAAALSATRMQTGLSVPVIAAPVTKAPGRLDETRIVVGTRPSRTVGGSGSRSTTVELPSVNSAAFPIVTGSAMTRLDRPLVLGWIALSSIGLIVIALSMLRLSRPGRRWSMTTVDGVPVFLSHDLGPAVIGVLRYRIVLPSWTLELQPAERDLILAHEREHANAGDPSLLLIATVLIAAAPWNLALWFMARRLRFSIELDCDARVLRHRSDARAYGSLLLDVSERTLGGAMPVAALSEPVSLVERRIAAMTARVPRFAAARGFAAAVVASTLVIFACATPHPAPAPAVAQRTASADSVRARGATAQAVGGAATARELDRQRVVIDSLKRLLAAADARRASENRPDTALYRQMMAMLDSTRKGGGSGASTRGSVSGADTAYPRVVLGGGTLAASVTRDLAKWKESPGLLVARINRPGSAVITEAAAGANSRATSGSGGDLLTDLPEAARRDRRVARARSYAMQYFPASFTPHEGEIHLVVLVIDSTGSPVRVAWRPRPATVKGERISDRDVLKLVMPRASMSEFYEWGMANISSSTQSENSGVVVLYAFTSRSPW